MRKPSNTTTSFTENNSNKLTEMIKFVANEPSMGLFYVQQHIRKSIPNLVNLRRNVIEKSHETALHGEDLEDSITMTKSMKECGLEVVDVMIREIESSITTLSKKQLERESLHSSRYPMIERTNGYLSDVLKSAKQRGQSLYSFGTGPREEASQINMERASIDSSLITEETESEDILWLCDDYDKFQASKEAKFEEWLGDDSNEMSDCMKVTQEEEDRNS